MAINIQAVTVGPKKVVSIKFISRGTPNAAPEIRFCNPVPMFWRLVILAFKSTVLLLYTANWNRQKYTQPATNTAQPMQAQYSQFAGCHSRYHQEQGDEYGDAVQNIFGTQQCVDGLLAAHQPVDVVAFVTHQA